MDEETTKIFNDLVSNAFEFLNRSIDEFIRSDESNKEIKYSIIHFCIAVENILKAELIWEHWSLIFQKPEQASKEAFLNGNFTSASISDTLDRLKKIGGRAIAKEIGPAFKRISDERNKIIHFNNNISKKVIAQDQIHAWYYLDSLLRSWSRHFYNFIEDIRKFRKRMGEYRDYLKLRYDKIKASLESYDKNKILLATCPICRFNALVCDNEMLAISEGKCRVCEHEFVGITLVCQKCNNLTILTDEHITTCNCHHTLSAQELFSIIEVANSYYADVRHGEEVDWKANCTECQSNLVIRIKDGLWFCTECFTTFDSVTKCNWCNHLFTGDDEDTYLFGCGIDFCGGKLGSANED